MRNTNHLCQLFSLPRKITALITTLLMLAVALTATASAQTIDRETRAAQWEAYKPAPGKFVRFVDHQKGYSLWHPAEWKSAVAPNGLRMFQSAPQASNLLALIDTIPGGFGVANYASSYLQGLKNERTDEDSVLVRRVMMNGLEWREISYDVDQQGTPVHQTMWVTTVGERAYAFVLSALPSDLEKDEPILKRIMMTVRIGAASNWNDDFEALHKKFSTAEAPAGVEIIVAAIADELRIAKLKFAAAVVRLTELFNQPASSAAALELLTDADPQIRAAAITALGKARSANAESSVEALLWAINDKDAIASNAAALALAERGAAGLAAVKAKLATLAENPAPLVRYGLAAGEATVSELIAELLRSDKGKSQLTAMLLALALPKLDQPLPFVKLLTATEPGLANVTTAVMQKHFRNAAGQKLAADAVAELTKLLRTDQEWWAVRALGEIATPELGAELKKRIAEIDARLTALGKAKQTNAPKPSRRKKSARSSVVEVVAYLPPEITKAESLSVTSVAGFKAKPEDIQLALVRGELDTAARKLGFRDKLAKAKTPLERLNTINEFARENYDLASWARALAADTGSTTNTAELRFDAAKLANAPTTGETVFPKNSISYVMSPSLNATIEKLDAALSGVQMGTVRDQMTLALILKMLKTTLADKTGTSTTGDASTATGIDLKAPMAMANWGGDSAEKTFDPRSAVVLRVTDRVRFERLLLTYHDTLGDLNSVTIVTAALSRFAGLLPAALPVVFAAVASDEGKVALAGKAPMSAPPPAPSAVKPFELVRQEKLGDVTAIVFDKPTVSANGGVSNEALWLAYLGETAVLASSQAALIDALQTASGAKPAIVESAGFAQVRREQGEIVFFSDLKGLLNLADTEADLELGKDQTIGSLLKAFGAESGALRLTPNSWDTVFNISLGDNEFTGSFQSFKADALAVPKELLPASTMFYAGAVVDPAKLFASMKKSSQTSSGAAPTASTASTASTTGPPPPPKTVPGPGVKGTKPAPPKIVSASDPAITVTPSVFNSQDTDEIVEKQIVPEMQGEIGAAVLSFKPLYEDGEMPAIIFAAKLKSDALAAALKSRKLFPNLKPEENLTVLGSPVIALGAEGAPYAAITNEYLLLADRPETLKLLEASSKNSKERFATSRDFIRSLQNAPENVALFATYNLESAFEEAAEAMSKSDDSKEMLIFVSALVHAFHSQRAFVTLEKDGLRGGLSVSFDREGRFAVGDLAARSGEFDIANASIRPKGLNVTESTRVESMSLKVAANRPGVAPRVRDDLAKFPWQKVESSTDNSVIVNTNARHIPETATVKLPVSGTEFAQFLAPTAQINSKSPEIIELSKQIAGDDKDGRSVARKIGDWTHRNLKWKKVQSDTVETLASREADCLEHSELYVALARSLGLPARVVSGAALSGGSFGAHAWVEVYLGKWVELDPTWGLMEHVDATHLRFDGDAFTSYAMLNQIELEVMATRRTVAEFQRDPVRLVKEFSLSEATRDLAFDLSLTAEHALGAERWNKLDDKQRLAITKTFERTVDGLWDTWSEELPEPVRVIRNETKGAQKALTVLRGEAMFRFTLTQRDGAWFIVEHEIIDDALPEFADALNGVLTPEAKRGRVFEVPFEAALQHLDKMIAAEGEKPELLLLKARVLDSQQNDEEYQQMLKGMEKAQELKDKPADQQTPPAQPAAPAEPRLDRSVELLKQVVTRWPNFPQAQLALGRQLVTTIDDGALSPLSKDAEAGVAALQAYARLVPDDPRVWRELATAYEQLEKEPEAEAAYRSAIERDGTYLDHHSALVNFLLNHEHLDKAKTAFAAMLKTATNANGDIDEAFDYLDDGEGFDPDSAKLREDLLAAFTKEVSASQSGLRLLANVQEAQDKLAEAIKTIQRSIAIEATFDDYHWQSRMYRKLRRFTEALNAANNAVKLDDSETYAQFERACSLAQLGRKREAITALKELIESMPYFNMDDPDLQPLATMPEFKALKDAQTEKKEKLKTDR
ncbi:MAG: transglutaminase domain-containing protein [Blastocatellia bacterium]